MKLKNIGLISLLLVLFSTFGMGCEPYHRGPGIDVTVHDNRWHYDHDYDDSWRANHPWHADRNDWDH